MKVEAILKNGHYIIPYLEKINFNKDHLTIEIDERIFENKIEVKKSETYKQLEKLNKELGGNKLIEAIMKGMPFDYIYKKPEKTDREIWYEAVKEKYE
ncbi:MAG: hypothetical protein K8S23_05760 [Candidatus Cloacimonetes bacterium]|nr:hypothetical protein [Candidatus Cloacimonadota bacterium]